MTGRQVGDESRDRDGRQESSNSPEAIVRVITHLIREVSMHPLVVAATGPLALVVALSATPTATAEETGPVSCSRNFHITLDPPLTFAEGRHTFVERGRFLSCSGPGATDSTAC
jgi:hypothetical protein